MVGAGRSRASLRRAGTHDRSLYSELLHRGWEISGYDETAPAGQKRSKTVKSGNQIRMPEIHFVN